MPQGFARILPSGRAVRWVNPSVSDYKAARNRTQSEKFSDLADALMPYVLTGITGAPGPRIGGEPVKNKDGLPVNEAGMVCGEGEEPARYIDEAAMIASVGQGAAGGWIDLTYEKLKTKNGDKTLFDTLFDDYLGDFLDVEGVLVAKLIEGFVTERPPMARPVKV